MGRLPFIAGVLFVVLYSWEGPHAQVREGNRNSARSNEYLSVSEQAAGFAYDAHRASWTWATVFTATQKFIVAPSERAGAPTGVAMLVQTYRDKLHAIVALDSVESEHSRDEQGQWTEKDGGDVNPHVASIVTAAKTVSERMGFDVSRIDVVEVALHVMEVGGRIVVRSAFYDPENGRIQVNAPHTSGSVAAVQGLMAHEITHAQQDALDKVMAQEHDAIRDLSPEERNRLFMANGFPRKFQIPEIEQRWPASATMAKAAPGGDSWLGTWSRENDNRWAFDPDACAEDGGRLEWMAQEGSFTEYSKLYWTEYHNATDEIEKALWKRRAIQETLAEVATYHERSSQGEWDEGVPSKSWQQFEAQVRQIYPTIKSRAGR